ncbi:unnamed protein product [Tilletia caries]|uniref:Chitobiosyldiphosphodolichol beta-mannosyltransferase n=1 Tax=Tilletia caries TaxID=13290 RepID=A0A177U1B0_9BASI|nr:hypothetical protein CF336_g8181 [Tilletia laevis]KAE8185226.1 hypothetical protein CF335_g7782 [Tilletia laevis]KAE8243672.1 hypothetical protein A4X03_0g7693 [Tilletia caries]CAD6887513.1 unnamed protein product [Tilletia caries]CAD6912566.1 unnamed protein product [Tilletia caries]
MFIPALIILCSLGALSLFPLFLVVWVALHRSRTTTNQRSLKRSAAVVVLGDVGRSPRMCYHAQSLANEGWKVGLVGYNNTTLPPPLQRPSVRLHALIEPPGWFAKLPKAAFIVVAPLKIAIQSTSLFWALAVNVHPPPELILVQTPPALPTLFIVRLVAFLLRARVIIDWHNLGYTILGLRLGPSHPLVKLAGWLERVTGRTAFAHLFVTHAMKRHLDAQWGLQGHKAVLHDRPPVHFRRAQTHETHTLFKSLAPRIKPALADFWPTYTPPQSTPFTREASTKAQQPSLRPDRPVLAVSSTSWTADEDFDILLEAARKYEFRAQRLAQARSSISQLAQDDSHTNSASSSSSHLPITQSTPQQQQQQRLPKLLIIVTGKGQLRSHYERLIAMAEQDERWKFVRIRTAWLEVEEYPILLGSADIGISLHSSSSGLDLPMKVVDMLGCGLPVLALDFPCLPELISDGRNGLVFNSAGQLADQLAEVAFSGAGAGAGVRAGVGSAVAEEGAGAGAGEGRNWMVKAMEEDEALAFGWGDEPPEAIVAAASLAASARAVGSSSVHQDRLGSLKLKGAAAHGLPTHSSPSGTSSPSGRESVESGRPSVSLVGSPVLGSGHSGARAWDLSGTGANPEGHKRSARARKVATWTGNWRQVVRPLLNASEESVGEGKEGLLKGEGGGGRDGPNAERTRRKLERAKRKGKGLSVHHRKAFFGGSNVRQDEDYLLHYSDNGSETDDDDEEEEQEEKEKETGTGTGTAIATSGGTAGEGLISRKQRNATTTTPTATVSSPTALAAISIRSTSTRSSSPPSLSLSPTTDRTRSDQHQQQQQHGSHLVPSHSFPHSLSYFSSPSSPNSPSSPLSFPALHYPSPGNSTSSSEPLSPASSSIHHQYHSNGLLANPSSVRRLSAAGGGGGGLSAGGGHSPGTSSSDADKRWRRRRTYSGSSSLYNGDGDRDRDEEDGGGGGGRNPSGVKVQVELAGEFVTPFELAHGLNGNGGPGTGSRRVVAPPLHSPLASPARRTSVVSLYPDDSASALMDDDDDHAELGARHRAGGGGGGVRILPSRQLDSHWSPQGQGQGQGQGARRGSSSGTPDGQHAGFFPMLPPRKSWSAGDGDVPDIRVSPAMS